MKIVIKIPEKDYSVILTKIMLACHGCKIIELPKGHGELKDANELKKVYDERLTYLYTLNKKDNPSREAKICATNWCKNTIDELPTIIEVDKESEVEKGGH